MGCYVRALGTIIAQLMVAILNKGLRRWPLILINMEWIGENGFIHENLAFANLVKKEDRNEA